MREQTIRTALDAQIALYNRMRQALVPLPGRLTDYVDLQTLSDGWELEVERKVREHLSRTTKKGKQPLFPWVLWQEVINGSTDRVAKSKVRTTAFNYSSSTISSKLMKSVITDAYSNDAYIAGVTRLISQARRTSKDLTFVTTDMLNMIRTAVGKLPKDADHDYLEAEDMISPTGFIYFESPVTFEETFADGSKGTFTNAFRAIGWDTETTQIVTGKGSRTLLKLSLYTDVGIYRYLVGPQEEEVLGTDYSRQIISHLSPFRDSDLVLLDSITWVLGTAGDEFNSDESHLLTRRIFLTMMRFARETLIIKDRETIERNLTRTARRDIRKNFDISVLRLRRTRYIPRDDKTGTGFILTHRIMARGHWRYHYYPKQGPCYVDDHIQNPASHRWIWIPEHPRGPKDKPLIKRAKVNLVTR